MTNGANVETTDYISGIHYVDGQISFIQTATGRMVYNGSTFDYEYNLTDHLGNVRVVFNDQGIVEQTNDYYPFGGTFNSYTSGDENLYKFGGKEEQQETGLYDFEARMYDPWLGRFNSIDPLADAQSSWNPYHYAYNNPLIFVDPTGMFGEYYLEDGTYIGSDGIDDDMALVVSTDDNCNYTDVTELDITNTELVLLASTSYGESSTANNATEMSAISSAIVNNQTARGDNATITSTIDGFAFAATDGNARATEFNDASAYERNGTSMQSAVAGAINAATGGTDHSNGATHWAGDDVGSSTEKRATGGLLVTNTSHDIHSVGSQTINGAPKTTYWYNKNGKATSVRGTYSYTWETTAGHGGTTGSGKATGTTFMRKTDSFIQATGAPRY